MCRETSSTDHKTSQLAQNIILEMSDFHSYQVQDDRCSQIDLHFRFERWLTFRNKIRAKTNSKHLNFCFLVVVFFFLKSTFISSPVRAELSQNTSKSKQYVQCSTTWRAGSEMQLPFSLTMPNKKKRKKKTKQ